MWKQVGILLQSCLRNKAYNIVKDSHTTYVVICTKDELKVKRGSWIYVSDVVILSTLLLWSATGVDILNLVKIRKKNAFYPNWKIFSQKFLRWNVELDERKKIFDIVGTLKVSGVVRTLPKCMYVRWLFCVCLTVLVMLSCHRLVWTGLDWRVCSLTYLSCFVSSLLDDPDTQVTMKTLGLMRNLLSGREVTLSFVCSFFLALITL